jgi:hypothetical protein
MLNVLLAAGEEVVDDGDLVAVEHKAIHQV